MRRQEATKTRKKRQKILKVRYTGAGLASCILFGAGLLVVLLALFISFRTYGQGGAYLSFLGTIAFFLFLIGLSIAIGDMTGRPVEEGKPFISVIGSILSGIGILAMIGIYVIGIIF